MDHAKLLRMIFTAVAETKDGNAIVVFTYSFLNWANGRMATWRPKGSSIHYKKLPYQTTLSLGVPSSLLPKSHTLISSYLKPSKWSVRLKSTKPPLRCCQASKTWASNCTKKCIGANGVKEMYQFVLLHFPIKEYQWESPQEHLHTSCCGLPCMETLHCLLESQRV